MNSNQIVVFFSSILVLILFVKLLKYGIKQERPIVGKTYGMPSSRSALILFMVVYLTTIHTYDTKTTVTLYILSSLIVYLKYAYKEHSLEQLLVGALIGSIFGKVVVYLTN